MTGILRQYFQNQKKQTHVKIDERRKSKGERDDPTAWYI